MRQVNDHIKEVLNITLTERKIEPKKVKLKHQTFIRRTRRDYTRPIVWGIIGLITIILIVKVLQIITQ